MGSASDDFTTVAFYGIETSARAIANCYDAFLNAFDVCGCSPERMGVTGSGFSGRIVKYSSANRLLERRGFADVEAVEVHSLPPVDTSQSADGDVSASVSRVHDYATLSARSDLVSLDALFDVARAVVAHLHPIYGIGYYRNRGIGPSLYAIGINYGTHEVFSGPQYEEKCRITSWATAMSTRAYAAGTLRDVYPWNFLTEPHLSRAIDGLPLRDWIACDPTRGTLSPFENDVWLWSITDGATPNVRDRLAQNGAIWNNGSFRP